MPQIRRNLAPRRLTAWSVPVPSRHRQIRRPQGLRRTAVRRPTAGGPTTTVVAVALFGVEAVGLRAGGSALVACTVLIAAACVLMLLRSTLITTGIGAACLAAFTMPWNGWLIGAVRPGDLFILIGLACFVLADIRSEIPTIPIWARQLGVIIVVVAFLHVLLPTAPTYLTSRVVVGPDGRPFVDPQTNLGVAFKFVVAVLAIPLVFCFVTTHARRGLRWLMWAYVAGSALSGLVAYTDGLGLTSFGRQVTGNYSAPSREAGFSNHPNFLAAGCVLAASIAVWLCASRDRREQAFGFATTGAIVLGTYASGSRGGAICLVLAVAATLLVVPRFRPGLPAAALISAILGVASFVVFPSFGGAILRATRLGSGNRNASDSDLVRAIVHRQGWADFRHSPFDGIGLQVAAEAHNVYLQELAAGGVLLFVSLLAYTLGALRSLITLLPRDEVAGPLIATLVAGAVFGGLEDMLTDRFVYVPFGFVAALLTLHQAPVVLPPAPRLRIVRRPKPIPVPSGAGQRTAA